MNAVSSRRNTDLTRVKIHIKGIRDGLLVTPENGTWVDIRTALLDHLKKQADFLRGGRLILDAGNQDLITEDIIQLRDSISELGLVLWGILSRSPITEQNAQNIGLVTRITRSRIKPLVMSKLTQSSEFTTDESVIRGEQALLLKHTLRSGTSLKHNGHVILIGNINQGAEIIAGGDIFVWGQLRGMVHAGANGNQNSEIYALDFRPSQLLISNHAFESPLRRTKDQPMVAKLLDGNVVIQVWKNNTPNPGILANLPLIPIVRKRKGKI